jgi:hypothetical protein
VRGRAGQSGAADQAARIALIDISPSAKLWDRREACETVVVARRDL